MAPYRKRLSSIASTVDVKEKKHTLYRWIAELLYAAYQLSYPGKIQGIEAIQMAIADGSKTEITHQGRVTSKVSNQLIWLGNVYYVPPLRLTITSCSKLGEEGLSSKMVRKPCSIHYWKEGSRYLDSVAKDNQDVSYRMHIIVRE